MNATALIQARRQPLENYPARLRPDEVAAYLGCTVAHVTTLIKDEALQAANMATPGSKHASFRVTREALASFEQSRKAE